MKKPLISVIIPVYNVADYIPRIMSALLQQTYPNIEIILVDDDSRDESYEICKNYSKKYNNVHAFHKENGGAASTRNYGIERSAGDYIMFVDADDYVTDDYVDFLYKLLVDNKADIAICGFKKFFGDDVDTKEGKEKEVLLKFTAKEALEDLLYRRHLTNSPWAKLLKKNLVKDILFPEGMLYEDLAVVYKWLGKSNAIVYSSKVKYYYFQRVGSSMHCEFNRKKLDKLIIAKEMSKYIEEKYPSLEQAANSRLFISILQLIREVPLTESYDSIRVELKAILKKVRKKILIDNNNSYYTRVLAMISFSPYIILKGLGNLADWAVMRFKIVQKH